MQIIDYQTGSYEKRCVFLLGYFDGVHIGHRKLIEHAKNVAQKSGASVGIMTFYDSKNGKQIYTFDERVMIFDRLGIDFVCAASFGEKFRATEPEEFLRQLVGRFHVAAFVCGADYTYGRDASGNVSTLRSFCEDEHIELIADELVDFYGEKAAAASAKQYLDAGDVQRLALLLGERYFVCGTVETEGRHIGRKLGFPTANIHIRADKYPLRSGVYAVSAEVGGTAYRGIANFGSRPTFGDDTTVLEIYLDGYNGDLYGKKLIVCFDARIRDIKKFDTAQQLSAQLKKDLESIR